MNHETIIKAAMGAIIGLVIGWGANSLTLAGRVDAIERSLGRIESAVFQLKPQQARP